MTVNLLKYYNFLVVNFENLTVTEPAVEILPDDVYADVLVLVNDEDLIDIACKEISVEDALVKKILRVFGDKEIGGYLIKALKDCLPLEKFEPRPKPEPNDDYIYFYADGETAEDYDDEYEQHYASGTAEGDVEKSTNNRCGINF